VGGDRELNLKSTSKLSSHDTFVSESVSFWMSYPTKQQSMPMLYLRSSLSPLRKNIPRTAFCTPNAFVISQQMYTYRMFMSWLFYVTTIDGAGENQGSLTTQYNLWKIVSITGKNINNVVMTWLYKAYTISLRRLFLFSKRYFIII